MSGDPDETVLTAERLGIAATPFTATEVVIEASALDRLLDEVRVRREAAAGAPLMTDDEHALIDVLSDAAGRFNRMMRQSGRQNWEHDWAEAADKIHQLQAQVLSMAAARAYPDRYRPMLGAR